ncbi:hypothetical protein HPB51_005780 [Rhipicephalus microplus]|uniref:Malate dehydrogenase n=1 Tax=Rhipicephalus microplus TaxID=6941 RepID=A0A9J6EMA2_RHIMP|nr:hypothetical protein HPB51_005780 [Rhipicephalus microplus]
MQAASSALRVVRLFLRSPFPPSSFVRSSPASTTVVRMAAASVKQDNGIVVPKEEMRAFIVRCMRKVGTDDAHAQALAEVLVAGDYRGHFSHGMNRLQMYVTDIEKGVCEPSGKPVVINELGATALVDGKNLLGPVVGKFCMELAIQKAQQAGIGWVVAKGSNHYGIAGYYSMMASSRGMIGMSCTNASPLVAPSGGRKVEMQHRKGEAIPSGWGINGSGEVAITHRYLQYRAYHYLYLRRSGAHVIDAFRQCGC